MLPWIKSAGMETTKAHRNRELPPNVEISYSVLESEVNSLRSVVLGGRTINPVASTGYLSGSEVCCREIQVQLFGRSKPLLNNTMLHFSPIYLKVFGSYVTCPTATGCLLLSRFAERLNNAILNNNVLENTGF